MQGRLENQIKTEKKIDEYLIEMPKIISDYYINFSASREFRSCFEYIRKIKMFLSWYADINEKDIKDIDCLLITDLDIAQYMKFIETKETISGMEYTSFSYRKQNWSILNSFFTFLQKKGLRNDNPMQLIDYPSKKDNVKHVFLSKDDLDKVVEAVVMGAGTDRMVNRQAKWKERDLCIVYTFIFTGMRKSALSEINIDNVDLKNNIITVIDKEHSTNTYSIPGRLKKVIMDWLVKREELLGDKKSDALFISNQRKRLDSASVSAIIRKYSKEALGQEISPHRIRAAYGNILLKQTDNIHLTSKAMKHKNISTTEIYMEQDESVINETVANILGEVF